MYIGLIARRYAMALAKFAEANGEEKRTYDDMLQLIARYREVPDVRVTFFSPVLSVERKVDIMHKLIGRPMCGSLEKFIRLVVLHRRERYLYFMLNSYAAIYKQRHNIRDALLVTAAPMDDKVVERIWNIAQIKTRSNVDISRKVDPELIGGFVFRIDDVLIDASVAGQLARVKRELCGKPQRIV